MLEILKLVEEADEFVSQRNTGPRGPLKVTAPTCFSRFHVAPHLSEFVARYPQIQLDIVLTDNFVDIIRDGFDVAIRIGELPDSSLVARKLAPDTRVICAAPAYLAAAGTPKSLDELGKHNCLSAGAQDVWRLEGPEGLRNVRVKGNIRSNSAELVREALVAGLGLGLRSIWEIGPELETGALKAVLPQYRGSSQVAIYAVYPSRDFMPTKVSAFVDFLAEKYGAAPYWEKPAQALAGRQLLELEPPLRRAEPWLGCAQEPSHRGSLSPTQQDHRRRRVPQVASRPSKPWLREPDLDAARGPVRHLPCRPRAALGRVCRRAPARGGGLYGRGAAAPDVLRPARLQFRRPRGRARARD